jgi:hypothetical protein
MKIYKFKDLTDPNKHSHFIQIILGNSIWSARPDSLNDEDEFIFGVDCTPSSQTEYLLTKLIERNRVRRYLDPHISQSEVMHLDPNISALASLQRLESIAAPIMNDMIRECRDTIGITSFSTSKTDCHLWDEYGGYGNGVCIEIDVPDFLIGQMYHKVVYVQNKIFHVDSILESALFKDKAIRTYENILLTKTRKWEQEEEIRFIGKVQNENWPINGSISEVAFGPNVPEQILQELMTTIGTYCLENDIRVVKFCHRSQQNE